MKITSFKGRGLNKDINPKCEEVSVQEAWIDDQSSEEIANFVDELRNAGAYDVSYHSINMKKDRVGFSIQVILPIEKRELSEIFGF